MTVIVCLDDRDGMLFNGRRQSRDRRVCEDIASELPEGGSVLIDGYSRGLLCEAGVPFICADGFLDIAGKDDVCFVENRPLSPYADRIERLIIYRWNRHYPSDMTIDITPSGIGLTLCSATEFTGNAHEKITKEIYER